MLKIMSSQTLMQNKTGHELARHYSFVISFRRVSVVIIPVSDILCCSSHSIKFSSNFRLSDSSTSESTEVWFCFCVRVKYWTSSDTGHLQRRLKFELVFALVRYCTSNVQSAILMPVRLLNLYVKLHSYFLRPGKKIA